MGDQFEDYTIDIQYVNYNKKQLSVIYKEFNKWKWPDILGDMPEWWYDIPKFPTDSLKNLPNLYTIVSKEMEKIAELVTIYEIEYNYNVGYMKKTENQFKREYIENRMLRYGTV